ncbi:MAG: hypothetical protein R3B90_23390 [Planctomycetaceae bacterium]
MVLLAGVTGSGKSTTIASMLDWITTARVHILDDQDDRIRLHAGQGINQANWGWTWSISTWR